MIDTIITAWLAAKAARGSAETHRSYSRTLAAAREALQAQGLDLDSPPATVATALATWLQVSRRGAASSGTRAKRLAILASFYEHAQRTGALTGDPTALIERPVVEPYAASKTIDVKRVQTVLGELREAAGVETVTAKLALRDLALLRVALTTGRRVAELAALRWRDVSIVEDGEGLPREVTLTWRAKGGKTPRDTLAPSVGADFLTWVKAAYPVETLHDIPSDGGIWLQLAAVGSRQQPLDAQGLRAVVERRLGVNPHQLRHTFSHAMAALGAPASAIQARLGHNSLATTGRYLAQLARSQNAYAGQLADLFDGKRRKRSA